MSRDAIRPDAPARSPREGNTVQHMPPAPALPGVLDEAEAGNLRVQPASTDVLSRARDFTRQVARVHQEYLEQSTGLHRAFLALWQGTGERLAAGRGAARLAGPGAEAAPASADGAPPAPVPAGMSLSRDDLIVLASGRISSVFGSRFRRQDGHAHQMRPAKPPLLFADRVTRIAAEPGSLGKGTIWSETDVTPTSWYLDDAGRMPAGVLSEAGQAHIVLLSWLGADWLHDGERRCRLLGTEVALYGPLPKAGDTCVYEIHVDGHTRAGGTPLFFVHYDCSVGGERRASLRFQVGLFTAEELAAPGTVSWTAAADDRQLQEPFDPPDRCTDRRAFPRDAVLAFVEGRPGRCFGRGFERADAHVRTPKITAGRLRQIEEIEEFDPAGGPWRRGYLRAVGSIAPDAWFFDAHFHDDPCMPGFLMLDGGLQAMAFYLAALGFTLERDGWRFEPVHAGYAVAFRGQITPGHRRLTYELFVESVTAAPEPTVVADILLAVDGRTVFHVRRARLRLVPDFPLEYRALLGPPAQLEQGPAESLPALGGLVGHVDHGEIATIDGLPLGWASLLAGALGRPSKAMGTILERFDDGRPMPRMPGPPFLFMSRTTRLDAEAGRLVPGASAAFAYDVPARVWYFEQQGAPVMPFAVLLEVMLQACGWLSFHAAAPLPVVDTAFMFRNLDGTGTVHAEVGPDTGTLHTRVRLLSAAPLANTSLVTFEVATLAGATPIATVRTTFGFFPPEAFLGQMGLPASPEERVRVSAPGSFFVDLTQRPARYCNGTPRLAGPMLLMLDRVTAFDPHGGPAGLGYLRGEKDVVASEWFFKAHFFRDPVQPGSLGLEALCQLLQVYLIERDLGAGIAGARFESLQLDRPLTWKYRGQVVPENHRIVTEIVVSEVGRNDRGPYAVADGWLWVDAVRVYSVTNLAVGVVGSR